jgi:hypothetical protein
MADAMIAWLQDQLALVLLSPPGQQEHASAAKALPFPLLERNSETTVDCLEDTSLQKASLKNMVRTLPPGGFELRTCMQCVGDPPHLMPHLTAQM